MILIADARDFEKEVKFVSQVVKCPKCGRIFSPMYSRTFACGGCPSASLGDCGMIKCPYCGMEFENRGESHIPRLI